MSKEKADITFCGDMRLFTSQELAVATEDFSSSNMIWSGGFGEVFKGRHMGISIVVTKILTGTNSNKLEKQIWILNMLNHPHILNLIGYDPTGNCLVSEYMSGGSLQDYLQGRGDALTWEDKVRICREIVSAVAYMHSQGVLHRDLKPQNILLNYGKRSKIYDMSSAKLCEGEQVTMSGLCGTAGYIDPYILETGLVGPYSDTYALGLVILQFLTGMERIQDVHELLLKHEGKNRRMESIQDIHELLGKHESENCSFDAPVSRWGGKDPNAFRQIIGHFVLKLDPRSSTMPKEALEKTVGLLLLSLERTREHRPDLTDFITSLEELECFARKGDLEKPRCDISSSVTVISTNIMKEITGDFSEAIGEGGFATVYKGKYQGVDVAVKKMKTFKHETFLREAKILHTIRHPHVLSILGMDTEGFCIVSEYMAGGSLQDWLIAGKRGILTWGERVRICREMTAGLVALHEKNVIHLDLNPANVLLDGNKISKIAGMGLAEPFERDERSMADAIMGTLGYIDPYLLVKRSYGKKSDTYALGLTMLQLMANMERVSSVLDVVLQYDKKLKSSFFMDFDSDERSGDVTDRMTEVEKYEATRFKDWPGGFEEMVGSFCTDNLDPNCLSVPSDKLHHAVGLILRCVERNPNLRPSLEVLLLALMNLERVSN